MDKLEPKKIKKIRPTKNTWYDWLINYVREPITKMVRGFKDEILSLFNTNTPKQTVYRGGKKLSKPKTRNKTNNIRNHFILKKKKLKIEQLEIFGHFFKQKKKKKKERNQ